MLAAGVNVALGSDSGNYSDFYDVGRQMYLAATIHREARGVMPTITAEQAIEMATINGAGRSARETGSVARGGQAGRHRHPPLGSAGVAAGVDPVNSLVYSAQSVAVDTVIVGGEAILEAAVHAGRRVGRTHRDRRGRPRPEPAVRLPDRHRWPVIE